MRTHFLLVITNQKLLDIFTCDFLPYSSYYSVKINYENPRSDKK